MDHAVTFPAGQSPLSTITRSASAAGRYLQIVDRQRTMAISAPLFAARFRLLLSPADRRRMAIDVPSGPGSSAPSAGWERMRCVFSSGSSTRSTHTQRKRAAIQRETPVYGFVRWPRYRAGRSDEDSRTSATFIAIYSTTSSSNASLISLYRSVQGEAANM